MENGLITGSPVNDAADLVPVYIEQWPIGPISGTYSANPIGSDPTFNSQNSNAIQAECSATTMTTQCPF
jgi:hypothetical protein